eukprot:TRINITY_DN32611_c0_g1_i1.p1 TRINITY_DN32611_c0_g1~~TRINITY_DN32611_c0_g1_i1.p1  ORF type:complete len:366 (-),score=51.55 TRINITY_DN32611_c0_g1_i1:130-1227(-)
MAHVDKTKEGWERSDFPILCETCLGENPYVRMTKNVFGAECKICARPYTVFRWKPGPQARFKKTEICQICSKLKNVCQTCLLDLDYGLPVQVMQSQTGQSDEAPKSAVHRDFFANEAERRLQTTGGGDLRDTGRATTGSEVLRRLQRSQPYYKRNMARICSFFVKGECNRGSNCPYRHEMPTTGALANQNMKDRYYGTNDPVAAKMLNRIQNKASDLTPPADPLIKTLYVGGVQAEVTEGDLRDKFETYGDIRYINVIRKSHCAFVDFSTRDSAEAAAAGVGGSVNIKGHPLRVQWGRTASGPDDGPKRAAAAPGQVVVGQAGGVAQPVSAGPAATAPSARGGGGTIYPSMDPRRMGTSSDKDRN